MLERRRPRDEFEIPTMPGGWVDYYTETQFNVQDVVQFQHLAAPSIIACAKQAVGAAKRRCVQAAASACQAPIRLYQVVRSVRHTQAARRRRPASPRQSPRQSPRHSPLRSPFPSHAGGSPQPMMAFSTPTHVAGHTGPTPNASTSSPHTPTTGHDDFDITWDAPSPSYWLNLSHDVKFIDLNKTPATPETPPTDPIGSISPISPISPRTPTAAGFQLMGELEEAASLTGDAPTTPTYYLPLIPQRKPFPSYMQGRDSDFPSDVDFSLDVADISSRVDDTRLDLTEFSSFVPFSPDVADDVSSHVDETHADPTQFSSHVQFSPEVADGSSRVNKTCADVTEFSSNVPFTPDVTNISSHTAGTTAKANQISPNAPFTPAVAQLPSHIAETAADATKISSNIPFSPDIVIGSHVSDIADDIDGFSSYVTDFPSHIIPPDWYEDPAVSPFNKSPESAPRRMTRAAVRLENEEQKLREERRLRNLGKAKIASLTEEWEDKVREALRVGLDPDFKPADFARVVPPARGGFTDSWLNDESVNGYLKLATKFHNADHPSEIPKSHAFPSFMLTQIARRGYKGVERWAKRAKIGGTDLLETHTIFIPVNSGSHWTLMVVYPGARVAHHYDSLGRHRSDSAKKWFDLLKIWLRGELGTHYNEREWSFFDKESPQQNNSSDCGVFAVTTAKMLILGADVLDYGPNDIPLQRKRIVAELVNGNFL
jgi:Ulp1 protease family, C-terminal catalytic domain